jgi:signal transduction histidine kinase
MVNDPIDKAQLIAAYSQHTLDSKYMRLIAHDVRNRMNTIMMANDMVQEEIDDAEGDPQKYLNMISRASEDILIILDAAVAALKQRDDMKEQEES